MAVSSRNMPITTKDKQHQDQDVQGLEMPKVSSSSVFDRLDRAQPVIDRAEAERAEDDPHEHAGDRQRVAGGISMTLPFQLPAHQAAQRRRAARRPPSFRPGW
jgi:hypothetical protein